MVVEGGPDIRRMGRNVVGESEGEFKVEDPLGGTGG